jgi:hypothetical protein
VQQRGRAFVHVVQQEHARLQPADQRRQRGRVRSAGRGGQPFEHAFLVALGLQLADEPGARVGQALVIEVDRVLRGQHHAQARGARLLEQRQQRRLRGRIGRRRHEPEQLVHVEHGTQARGARLPPRPGQQRLQQQRHEEHALRVVQVGDAHDRVARPAVARTQKHVDVERRALQPGREAGRGHQPVQGQGQVAPLGRREEGVDVEDAERAHGRLLQRADQVGQLHVLRQAPVVLDHRRQEDVRGAAHRVAVDARQP